MNNFQAMIDERWAEGVVSHVPQLARGMVWCTACGSSLEVNAAWRLVHGWPKCCGYTMTIDSPEERAEYARQREATDGD